jgi:hypothetical protein
MRLLLASAIVLLAGATSARADAPPHSGDGIERSDYAAQLPVGVAVFIDNPYGDVRVRFGGFAHTIDAHAVLQQPKAGARIAIEPASSADRYSIVPRLPPGATLAESQRLDLSVLVPEGHALKVRTGAGDIEVRGVHGDVDLGSESGNISLRGITGSVRAETGAGRIEASLGKAPMKSAQRLATRTGDIIVGVDDGLDAEVELATSGLFATEYSLDVTRRPGAEPNKLARAVIGHEHAKLALQSKRGEIRLLRRAAYINANGKKIAAKPETEDNDSD